MFSRSPVLQSTRHYMLLCDNRDTAVSVIPRYDSIAHEQCKPWRYFRRSCDAMEHVFKKKLQELGKSRTPRQT
jgi:hypothetical protein